MDEQSLFDMIDALIAEQKKKENPSEIYAEVPANAKETEESAEILPETVSAAEAESPAEVPEQPAQKRRALLRETLDEQPDAPADAPPHRGGYGHFALGLLIFALCVYGLVMLVLHIPQYVRGLTHHKTEEAQITACLLPLAVTDTPAFETPASLTDAQFLAAAAGSLLTSGALETYPLSQGTYAVPAAELIGMGNRLFGTNRAPARDTIRLAADLKLYYNAESECYLCPAQITLFTCTPAIRGITEENGEKRVTADYIAEQPSWVTTDAEIVKTMQFTILTRDGGYIVSAAKQIS